MLAARSGAAKTIRTNFKTNYSSNLREHQRRSSARGAEAPHALDSIALTVALEFLMLVDDGARERMLERRRAYERGELVESERTTTRCSVWCGEP